MDVNLKRSYVGSLRTPTICLMILRGRIINMQKPLMHVAFNEAGHVYASAEGSTLHLMVDTGRLKLIGAYTYSCADDDLMDDLKEAAKECGIGG